MKREDVISKHFNRAFMGYDMLEVDAFLDDVIRDIERLEEALADAELRAKVLSDELDYKVKFEGYVKKSAPEFQDKEADKAEQKAKDSEAEKAASKRAPEKTQYSAEQSFAPNDRPDIADEKPAESADKDDSDLADLVDSVVNEEMD